MHPIHAPYTIVQRLHSILYSKRRYKELSCIYYLRYLVLPESLELGSHPFLTCVPSPQTLPLLRLLFLIDFLIAVQYLARRITNPFIVLVVSSFPSIQCWIRIQGRRRIRRPRRSKGCVRQDVRRLICYECLRTISFALSYLTTISLFS